MLERVQVLLDSLGLHTKQAKAEIYLIGGHRRNQGPQRRWSGEGTKSASTSGTWATPWHIHKGLPRPIICSWMQSGQT